MKIITKPKTRRQNIALMVLILFGFLASGFSMKMSFSSQAPEGNWDEPWHNDCEEVSIVMVDSFYNNRILTPAVAKKEILRIIGIKEKAYGSSLDENAQEIADIINNFLNWQARIVENPTIEQIKKEIDNDHPVILPADGRKLNNRYYTTSEYHVFVISGYDDNKKMFIVQDGGTRRGHDYQYSYATIENAMHDYNSDDLAKGRRVVIFTSLKIKKIDESKVNATVSPALSAAPSATPAKTEEVKKDVSPTISSIIPQENIENGGLIKMIKNFWSNFIEWVQGVLSIDKF